MSEELPNLDKLLGDDFWEVNSVDDAIKAVEEAEKFKNVFRFLMERLRTGIEGDAAISPPHASAVLVDLGKKIELIDQAIVILRTQGLSQSRIDEKARKEREEMLVERKRRAQATLTKFGWRPGGPPLAELPAPAGQPAAAAEPAAGPAAPSKRT